EAYSKVYDTWKLLLRERQTLLTETRLSPDQIEFLRNQLQRFDTIDLNPEAIETLERDFQRMTRAQELRELASGIEAGLAGEDGVINRVGALLRPARQLQDLDSASQPLTERLQNVSIELVDLAAEFGGLGDQFSFEPEEMEQIQERMNTWLELKRKHGGDLDAVSRAREELRRKLEVQGDVEGALARLERQLKEAGGQVRQLATELRRVREK